MKLTQHGAGKRIARNLYGRAFLQDSDIHRFGRCGRHERDDVGVWITPADLINNLIETSAATRSPQSAPGRRTDESLQFCSEDENRTSDADDRCIDRQEDARPEVDLKIDAAQPQSLRVR